MDEHLGGDVVVAGFLEKSKFSWIAFCDYLVMTSAYKGKGKFETYPSVPFLDKIY